MALDGGLITIPALGAMVNVFFRIFRSISKWLQRKFNTLWREDHRLLKIVRDYFDRNTSRGVVDAYIQFIMDRLNERKIAWMRSPGAGTAEIEAYTIDRYAEAGYTTDIEPDDDDGEGGDEQDGDDNENW